MRLKVLSWNIWIGGDLEGVVKYIRKSGVHIVGLQEVVPERTPNVIEAIEALGYHSVFSTALEVRHDGKNMGNAIFSKYPIRNERTHILSESNPEKIGSAEGERRIAVQADIQCGGTILSIFTTHLAHTHQKSSLTQTMQAKNLIKLVPKERGIVMGDFNAVPGSETIEIMKRTLVDTDPTSQPTWSMYPEGCDVCNPQSVNTRLDYMFTTPDLKVLSSRVEHSKASDHLPISAEIEV